MKPENFLIGRRDKRFFIYLIDFGLSKSYKDCNGNHIPPKTNLRMAGTARYASIQAHKGNDQGRRDDLEALCYLMLYFIHGRLPWEGLIAETKEERYRMIHQIKEERTPNILCKNLPSFI